MIRFDLFFASSLGFVGVSCSSDILMWPWQYVESRASMPTTSVGPGPSIIPQEGLIRPPLHEEVCHYRITNIVLWLNNSMPTIFQASWRPPSSQCHINRRLY